MIIGCAVVAFVDWTMKNPSVTIVETARAQEEVQPREVRIEVIPKKIEWTSERIEEEVRATFPNEPNIAVAVAKSESGALLKNTAYNPEWHYDRQGNPICQGSFGVMQIACIHNIEDPEALFDVRLNLQKAAEIYEDSGWWRWGGYTSGKYKKYL